MSIHATYNPLPCEKYIPDLDLSNLDFTKYILDRIDKDKL